MSFQAQPRRKTICKSLINPVDMLLTECGNIGAVESVDKAGVFPPVANWLSISVFQAAAEFFGIFNAADTTITDTTIYLYNNKHIGEPENRRIRNSAFHLLSLFFSGEKTPSVDKSAQALKACFGVLLCSRRLYYIQ